LLALAEAVLELGLVLVMAVQVAVVVQFYKDGCQHLIQ
jgi:hypothetical protein